MSYKDSFIYSLRQKVGDMGLITVTVDVVPMDKDGKIKLLYVKHFDSWNACGGHVELGDSWQSAARRELLEECGIDADESDFELVGTMSGPGRIFRYADGTTQSFSLMFLCRHWKSESDPTDREESVDTGWFTMEEALNLRPVDPHLKLILGACKEYLQTGKVQHIVEK